MDFLIDFIIMVFPLIIGITILFMYVTYPIIDKFFEKSTCQYEIWQKDDEEKKELQLKRIYRSINKNVWKHNLKTPEVKWKKDS